LDKEISEQEIYIQELEAKIDVATVLNEDYEKRLESAEYHFGKLEDRTEFKTEILRQNKALMDKLLKGKVDAKSLIRLYTMDIDSFDIYVDSYMEFEKDMNVEQKVKYMCEVVSKYYFNGLKVEFSRFEDLEGQVVAVINLGELEDLENSEIVLQYGDTWKSGYFQGSTGGSFTASVLVNNFLQENYSGEWIDGVKFNYENHETGFQHIGDLLDRIFFRTMNK